MFSPVGLGCVSAVQRAETVKIEDSPCEDVFNETIRRINEAEKGVLLEKLASLPEKELHMEQLLTSINQLDLKAAIFSNPDFPYYALEALRKGLICDQQFGSIQIYWSVLQCHKSPGEIKIGRLFLSNGQMDSSVLHKIKETLVTQKKSKDSPTRTYTFLHKHGQWARFLEELKKLPLSEQYFLEVDSPPEDPLDWQSVTQEIREKAFVNVFNQISGTDGSKKRMIPSVGMMQAFLNAEYPESAVKIHPVLGLSSDEDFRQLKIRDVAVHFPGVTLPQEADTHRAPWDLFTYHDFYHAIVCSSIPERFRRMMFFVADIPLQILRDERIEENSPLGQTLRAFATATIDMEMNAFRQRDTFKGKDPDSRAAWIEFKQLNAKVFGNPNNSTYDPYAPILFYQRIVKELILDGRGCEFGFTEASLHTITIPQNEPMNPFNIMKDYLQKARLGQDVSVKLSHRFRVGSAHKKFHSLINQEFKKYGKEGEKYLASHLIPGSLDSLDGETRRLLVTHSKDVVKLLKLGISYEYIVSNEHREELINNSFNISFVIFAGLTSQEWMSLHIKDQRKFYDNVDAFYELMLMGASFQEVLAIDILKLELMKYNKQSLISASDKGVDFKSFMSSKLEWQ